MPVRPECTESMVDGVTPAGFSTDVRFGPNLKRLGWPGSSGGVQVYATFQVHESSESIMCDLAAILAQALGRCGRALARVQVGARRRGAVPTRTPAQAASHGCPARAAAACLDDWLSVPRRAQQRPGPADGHDDLCIVPDRPAGPGRPPGRRHCGKSVTDGPVAASP